MLSKAIQKAKGDEEKKIGVSLKMPESFKNKLQLTADNNGVSLNALIIAMLETVYESKEDSNNIYDRYQKLSNDIRKYDKYLENGVSDFELGFDPYNAKKLALSEIRQIEQEIENLED
ncbi:hypothetical protein [Halarcobacter sp.]|uniref:hypothetical protein n=1 Tax=Halarcobacter sp. TaxID=2321133 RepID=UPI002AAB3DC4|nr:hypothetical protein [Halarcobacter sp.]